MVARVSARAETFEEYTARILGYVRGRDVRRVLRATPGSLEKLVSGASRRRLSSPPARKKWSATQILAHLAEIELLWGYRIRLILERDGCEIVGMDQDAWARNSRYDRTDPEQSIETFRAIRRANLDLLGRLSPGALRRHGTHSQFGKVTIARITALMAGHDINHSRQIAMILKKRKAGRKRR